MQLSEELQNRGFIYQHTGNISDVLDKEKRVVYLGIDPTANSIHVGNLVPYMLLNHLLNHGHTVILLLGGGTALIGDPGGKSEERPFVSLEVVAQQAKEMEDGIKKFVSGDIKFVNNYDWLSKISMIEYLRDVGKHFTVNAMIKKDIVANRLTEDNSISYTEFSYSLLQGYDYYHLHTEYKCSLQIGGSDQWSNILAGVEFVRKKTGSEVHALTMPLVTDKSTGKKFGKSEGNAIWLNPEKTTPYAFYQFWLQTSDESVIDYLKLFTQLSLEEISEIEKDFQTNPGSRSAQKILADQVTLFVHGETQTLIAQEVTKVLFGEISIKKIPVESIAVLKAVSGSVDVSSGTLLLDVVITHELASSKREARTFIESGAIKIDGKKLTDLEYSFKEKGLYIISKGKKQRVVIEVV